jgi:hypothetical protein
VAGWWISPPIKRISINGWMFTNGYIGAIRNLGLACFWLVIYTLSCKKYTKVANTHLDYRVETYVFIKKTFSPKHRKTRIV